jgi:TolB-like protein/Tfp pilus assembly protein PilF
MVDDQTEFLQELKQRKVFRVAVAYIVVAWVALQFFDLVLENIGAPSWVMQAIMALLAVGFPAALVLAWAFDVSAEGIRPAPGKSRAFVIMVVIVTAASLSYVGWSFLGGGQDEKIAGGADTNLRVIDSIAVLPFESFSENPQDEYFADGLADTLLHKLAQIETLKVIARNSSFQFKGSNRDAREIGEMLDVAALLEGSVQRQDGQVRIIAQLIDTSNGSHIWSETFDDSFQNIFELQDRIAQAILLQLRISITERERLLTLQNGTDSPEAFELLMRAIGTPWGNELEAFDPATSTILALIDQALEIDPGYAQAWAERAGIFTSSLFSEDDTARSMEYIDEARRAAEQAIEADPEYAGGYVSLGWSYFRAKDDAAAERAYVKALELAPAQADALSSLGLIKLDENPQFALELFRQAQELDPQREFIYRQISMAYDALGRLDESIDILLQGVKRFPDNSVLLSDLAGIYLYDMGNPDEAARWASQVVAADNQDFFGLRAMTSIWIAVGDADRAAEWLAQYADGFPRAPSVALRTAAIQILSGDAELARSTIESLPESPNFRFDRATPIGGNCLVLDDGACLREQAGKMEQWLTVYEAGGRSFDPGERYRMAIAVMRNAAIENLPERDLDGIQSLLDLSQNWPVTGGRSTRYSGYLRVMLMSLLGNDEEAVLELGKTLEFDDDGFLYRDIFRLPPDLNPVITRLAMMPGYAEWLGELSARREQARGRLVQMQRDGEIIAAADIAR